MTIRLLGVQIANGLSPEARVYARLLRGCSPGSVTAQTLFHDWPGDRESARLFASESGTPTFPLDFGWRSVASGRPAWEKVRDRLRFYAALPRALALARAANPDVIYSCQQFWDCRAATFLAQRLGKPQIIHLHYIIGPWLYAPVLERLKTCAHVLTVSEFIRDEALQFGIAPERVTAIRNTLPVPPPPEPGTRAAVRRELGIPLEAPLLGIVARLDPDKGQADTLRALARLRPRYPDVRLLVVGAETPWHPGYANTLRALSEELKLTEAVLFLGARPDVPRLLAALDIFVHPTRHDPCPIAPLEASVSSLPTVAYAEGGMRELVAQGETGLLATPGDVAALSACLEELLADPARARRMGQAARRREETQFPPERSGEIFTEIVRQVVHAPSRLLEPVALRPTP